MSILGVTWRKQVYCPHKIQIQYTVLCVLYDIQVYCEQIVGIGGSEILNFDRKCFRFCKICLPGSCQDQGLGRTCSSLFRLQTQIEQFTVYIPRQNSLQFTDLDRIVYSLHTQIEQFTVYRPRQNSLQFTYLDRIVYSLQTQTEQFTVYRPRQNSLQLRCTLVPVGLYIYPEVHPCPCWFVYIP